MKKYVIKMIKFFAIISIIIPLIFCAVFLSSDGRNFVLCGVSKYFESKKIIFSVKGLNANITKIDEIVIRSPDGIELIFSGVKLDRKSFLGRHSIYVDKFVLKGGDGEVDLNRKLKTLIPLMEKLRILVADLSLGNGFLFISDQTYLLTDLKYDSFEKHDVLCSKINKNLSLNVEFLWEGAECIAADIVFNNIKNFSGDIKIKYPKRTTSEYTLHAKNKEFTIDADGNYQNFMSDVFVRDAFIRHANNIYNCNGNIHLDCRKFFLKSTIAMEKLSCKHNDLLMKNFKNVDANLIISCEGFSKKSNIKIDINFMNAAEQIGHINCLYSNGLLKLHTEEFDIYSQVSLQNNMVNTLEMIGKFGAIKLIKPFNLSKKEDASFELDFKNFDCLKRVCEISGSAKGTICFKKGQPSFNLSSQKLIYKDCVFYALNMIGDLHDCKITSKSVRLNEYILNNLQVNKQHNAISIMNMDDNCRIIAKGTVDNYWKKITFKDGSIKSKSGLLMIQNFDADISDNTYKLQLILQNNKNKNVGNADLFFSRNHINIHCKKFHLGTLGKFFNRWVPYYQLDCALQLKAKNNCFYGDGSFTFSDKAHRNTFIINTTMGNHMKIDVAVKNDTNKMAISLRSPVFLSSNGTLIRSGSRDVDCHVVGDLNLDALFPLSKKCDLSGKLSCDFRVCGGLVNPKISGFAQFTNTQILVNDLVLKNGNISLMGEGNKIKVAKAIFVDASKKMARISGSGQLFFDKFIPNIKADLQISFDNFLLFDTESMSIRLTGNGNMSGLIDDLLISGNVEINECVMSNFEHDDTNMNDIPIENDANEDAKTDEQVSQRDFFKYDVKMTCPKVILNGSIFKILLAGNLDLVTHNGKAAIEGELLLKRGRLHMFGKRMIFTKGNVTFQKENNIDPFAFFACKRYFGDMSAVLEIRNTPHKGVDLRLHSRPSYPMDIILSKILFDKETKYLSISEAAQLASALSSMKQKNGYILSALNAFHNLGLVDNITFSESSSGNSYSMCSSNKAELNRNINISAGKYLHDNIYISVNKKEETTSFDVDFAVTQKMSIKANSDGEAGISWKYRY